MIPTMKIVNAQKKGPSPFLIINVEDFDPAKHKPYDESAQEKAAAKSAAKAVEDASKPWNDDMTKAELLEVGVKLGVDLNPRASKDDVVAELQKAWDAAQAK